MRRIGEPWRPGAPYRDRPGVYALIKGDDGRLLCVFQGDELQLPGGGIDPGEHPVAALHREVREETGWRIQPIRRIGAFQRFAFLPEYGYWARKVQGIWLARAVHPIGPPTERDHHPVWLRPDLAARALDISGDRLMVARALAAGMV